MRLAREKAPVVLAVWLTAALLSAQQGKEDGEKIAPYFPTPETIVDKMLKLGELKAGEVMFDLGSGDGRIVIDAAKKYKANAIGVELDDALFKQSMARIKSLGLTNTAHIIHGDLLKQDYSSADLLTVYLLPGMTGSVTPTGKASPKRAPALSPTILVPASRFDQTVDIDNDGEGRAHELYLYRR